jgi:hypothetical protein
MKTGFSPPDTREPETRSMEFQFELVEKLRREFARQLATPLPYETDAAREASLFANGFEIEFLKLLASESGEDSQASLPDPEQTPERIYSPSNDRSNWRDYVEGTALSMNPFAQHRRPYTYGSDLAALMDDWVAVRGDLFQGWAALVAENPGLRKLLESTAGGGAHAGRMGSKRP